MLQFGVILSFIFIISSNIAHSRETDEDICASIASDSASHKLILMDAGSSGVRVMAYCFEKAMGSSIFDLKLQTPLIESHQKLESGPSLPEEFDKFLIQHRPKELTDQNISRYFFLGATAGLRSLDGELARKTLLEKTDYIADLGYITEYKNNINLLSGLEEGSYTWFGVNYIMRMASSPTLPDGIKSMAQERKNQFGIIEMGGGSVQIAFSISPALKHHRLKRDTDPNLTRIEDANVKTFRLLDEHNLEVFAHSQPYKGLNFAYNHMVSEYLTNPATNPCLIKGTPVEDNGEIFHAFGNYDDCVKAIEDKVFQKPQLPLQEKGTVADTPAIFDQAYKDILPDKFFLTGYFFDRTTAMGFPEVFTPGYIEKVARYVCDMSYSTLTLNQFAKSILSLPPTVHFTMPFRDMYLKEKYSQGGVPRTGDLDKYCTHLTYMAFLLKQIGFSPDHILYTQKSLLYRGKGYGVSWPLGYAILATNGWK